MLLMQVVVVVLRLVVPLLRQLRMGRRQRRQMRLRRPDRTRLRGSRRRRLA
jgi:hypothetical protein